MVWQQSPYTVPVVVASVVTLAVASLAWRNRQTPGARSLVGLLVAGTVWSLISAFGLAVGGMDAKLIASKLAYIGIVFVPVAWFTFAVEYTGRGGSLLTKRRVGALLVIPLATLGFVFTNEMHGLIWNSVSLSTFDSLTVLSVDHGLWFWFWTAYAYILLASGSYLVIRMIAHTESLYRGQVTALILAVIVPWGLNASYLTGLLNIAIDPTPFGFVFSGLVLTTAVIRQHLLDVVPIAREVARDEIIETMDDPVVVLDTEDRVVDLNRAAAALAGERTEFIGEPVKAVIPPLAEALEADRARSEIEFAVGEETGHYDVRITPLERGFGVVTGRLVTLRDISERKRREQQLERYGTIIEASGDPVYTLDSDGRFTFVNDRLEQVTGYDAEQLLGEPVSILMDEEGVESGRRVVDKLIAKDSGGRETFEFTVTTEDGREIRCEGHVAMLPSDNGFRGTVGVVRDITERTERERRIEALHGATRELIKAQHPEEVARITAEAVADTLGYPNAVVRLLSDDGAALEPVASTEEANKDNPIYPVGEGPAGLAFERGEPIIHGDLTVLTDGIDRGEVRSAMYLPIGDYGTVSIGDREKYAFDGSDRRLVEILAAHTETALKRVERERELQRQNERLDEFAGIVSHDLRNPLNVALGRMALVQQRFDTDYIDDIEAALQRMDQLIDDVLSLARQGRTVVETEVVSFDEVVYRAWGMAGNETAELELNGSIDRVEVDESRLSELLENLFRNAIEHGGEDVTVTVGGLDQGFFVEDTGPGIPGDIREKVFESGFSGDNGGTGFGLAIVKEIAEAHGWSVSVTEGTTDGARFEITGLEHIEAT